MTNDTAQVTVTIDVAKANLLTDYQIEELKQIFQASVLLAYSWGEKSGPPPVVDCNVTR